MTDSPNFDDLVEFCAANILCDICQEGTGVRDEHGGWTCPSCGAVHAAMKAERERQGLDG